MTWRHSAVTRLVEAGNPYLGSGRHDGHGVPQSVWRSVTDTSEAMRSVMLPMYWEDRDSRGVPQKVPKVVGGAKCRGAVGL
jgi:hypothetical protein